MLFPFLLGGMVVFFAEKEDGTNNVAEAELFTEEKSMMQQNKVEVVNVYDGDSLDALGSNGKKIKLRLYGIDAPEKGRIFPCQPKFFWKTPLKTNCIRWMCGIKINTGVMSPCYLMKTVSLCRKI